MAESNRFSKPVAFNKKNEADQKILNHVKRRNFSGYVKKLILQDIEAREKEKIQNEEPKKLSTLEELKKRTERPSSPQVFSPSKKIDK